MITLSEIIKYFGLDNKIDIKKLTQSDIIYLIQKYYSEVAASK